MQSHPVPTLKKLKEKFDPKKAKLAFEELLGFQAVTEVDRKLIFGMYYGDKTAKSNVWNVETEPVIA